ncbi:membrane protein [Flavobacterium sp. 316]|uniref:O-antigen ligase family protein n=1 Tax=Flavobacterium sp. 316 TaxID=1603293 RepID=UPI0005E1D991|nr:O-antigen ligase family protein [Flavobacterium sp. 316]KIX19781.1 membrane protein [Flavobacterium sp. 316]
MALEEKSTNLYLKYVLFHLVLGGLVYVMPFLSKIYAIAIIFFGFRYVILRKNANEEALFVAAYIVGAEVFLRMTHGNFFEQYAKYGVISVLFIGIYFKSFSKSGLIYWMYGLLLVPGILISFFTLNFDTDIRKAITFNIIGPITLMVSAIYCYQRKITFNQVKTVIDVLAYPLIAMLSYMFLYTPSIRDVVTSTESNFQTSGGFGPNQVSTILGLGIFLFFVKLVFSKKNKTDFIINMILLITITFRGIVTFSRGGIITGFIMVILFFGIIFMSLKTNAKFKLLTSFLLSSFFLIGIWFYSSIQTGGLIDKRYANQDARGRVKESKLTGREKLIESEFTMFLDNPIFGVGVGKNKEYREETTGIEAASHNEISRMLAEHGSLGLFALLILLITPVVLYLNNRQNIFLFSFLFFWLLTINHAAMRLAAPAFVYALSLLKVQIINKDEEELTLHRE